MGPTLMCNLVESGYTTAKVVGVAADTRGVVDTVARLGATAVVVEIGLPNGKRLSVIYALRASHPDLRIVVCSFTADEATKAAALDAGADSYLSKPVSPRELQHVLA
jgi:two-component system OmpR family response regulator